MRLVLLLSAIVSAASCARILAVLPFPGRSHYIFYSSVLRTLTQRGHQVVEYGPYPPKEVIPNYTHVEVHTKFEDIIKNWKYEDFVKLLDEVSYFGQGATGFLPMLDEICNDTFQHKNIQSLLKSDEKFDLVITTSSFGQESMNVFGHKFGSPTITLQGFAYSSILNHPIGNVLSVATIPDTMSFLFSNRMTFVERFRNLVSVTLSLFKLYNIHLPKQDDIVKQHYKVPNAPTVAELARNVSLTFVNANPAVEYSIPYTPNIVPIAGISIVPERKPLPQDIKKFMDEAKHGVIYFSLGSNLPVHVFPKDFTQVFINVFKKLPQRVLWKNEAETLPGLSENVKLAKWVPQVGVIGHPNCQLFITHGGLFSQQEAIHAGVPTVGIPFFADQPYNIKFNEERGIGVGLNLKTLTEDSVLSAITTVLNNPGYKENTQRMSRIFRDRPMSPADSVVFWTEYVLRHAGAHHLRPASTQLTWYQLTLLDVLAAILLFTTTVITLLYLSLKKIFSLLFGSGSKNQTKLSKNKKLK